MSLFPVFLKLTSEPEATKRWLHALASQPMFEKFMEQANSSNSKQGVA